MPNLRFLNVYKSKDDGNDRMHIPEGMEFPRRLRLLRWEAYPSKRLPPTFHPEYLVKLDMQNSQLEYLWQGSQKLTNLKKMDLSWSCHLKELPDLSNATNLETLSLSYCRSLVEITSSCSHLHKLGSVLMYNCTKLEVIPADFQNSASLEYVGMTVCLKLRDLPTISTHIKHLYISEVNIEDDVSAWLPDCIKALHQLRELKLSGCTRLTSLPELPSSLHSLYARDCESLETIFQQSMSGPPIQQLLQIGQTSTKSNHPDSPSLQIRCGHAYLEEKCQWSSNTEPEEIP